MSVSSELSRAWEIIKLNEKAILQVAGNNEATATAVVFSVIAGTAYAINGVFSALFSGPIVSFAGAPLTVIVLTSLEYIVTMPLSLFVSAAIAHGLSLSFGDKGRYMGLVRPLGYSQTLMWPAVIPILGSFVAILLSIWMLVIEVVTIRAVHKISTGRAVAVVITPIVLVLLVGIIIVGPLF